MDELREAAMVKRMHVVRTIQTQTVAEHSYHVCMILWRLCDREPSATLLKAAMFHDLAESVTGDVPAPAKWEFPLLKTALDDIECRYNKENRLELSLSPNEEILLKWADSLELMQFCVDEIRLGNMNVDAIYHKVLKFLGTLTPLKNCLNELNKVRTYYAIANTR